MLGCLGLADENRWSMRQLFSEREVSQPRDIGYFQYCSMRSWIQLKGRSYES
jgi:hypothetical protein